MAPRRINWRRFKVPSYYPYLGSNCAGQNIAHLKRCLMSAIGPEQTCPKTQPMSLLGVKRTWAVALHMSAFDPKRTLDRIASEAGCVLFFTLGRENNRLIGGHSSGRV